MWVDYRGSLSKVYNDGEITYVVAGLVIFSSDCSSHIIEFQHNSDH